MLIDRLIDKCGIEYLISQGVVFCKDDFVEKIEDEIERDEDAFIEFCTYEINNILKGGI